MVFINKENRKYFSPPKFLTLESGSLHSTVFGKSFVSQRNRASARLQKKEKNYRDTSAILSERTVCPSPSTHWQCFRHVAKLIFLFFNIYIKFLNLVFKFQIPSNERNIRRIRPSSQEDSSHNTLQHRAPQTYLVITHLLYCTALLMQVIYYHMQNSYCY